MRRLLAVAAVATAVLVPSSAHAYPRECGGMVDMECHGRTCPTDCWDGECFVWIDLLHDSTTARCIGAVEPVN